MLCALPQSRLRSVSVLTKYRGPPANAVAPLASACAHAEINVELGPRPGAATGPRRQALRQLCQSVLALQSLSLRLLEPSSCRGRQPDACSRLHPERTCFWPSPTADNGGHDHVLLNAPELVRLSVRLSNTLTDDMAQRLSQLLRRHRRFEVLELTVHRCTVDPGIGLLLDVCHSHSRFSRLEVHMLEHPEECSGVMKHVLLDATAGSPGAEQVQLVLDPMPEGFRAWLRLPCVEHGHWITGTCLQTRKPGLVARGMGP